jgi:hypothetical protein
MLQCFNSLQFVITLSSRAPAALKCRPRFWRSSGSVLVVLKILSQLEACYAEDTFHWEAWVFIGVHAHGLEYGIHMVTFGQVQSCRVWLKRIQEDRRTPGNMATKGAEQRIQLHLHHRRKAALFYSPDGIS